jgi:hypothetical protein
MLALSYDAALRREELCSLQQVTSTHHGGRSVSGRRIRRTSGQSRSVFGSDIQVIWGIPAGMARTQHGAWPAVSL